MNLSDYIADMSALASTGMTEPWELCANATTAIKIMAVAARSRLPRRRRIAVHESQSSNIDDVEAALHHRPELPRRLLLLLARAASISPRT